MTDRMTWRTLACEAGAFAADDVIAWVNGLGGEARYYPETRRIGYGMTVDRARIVITGPDGDLIVHPGDTVIDCGWPLGRVQPSGPRRLFRVAAAGGES